MMVILVMLGDLCQMIQLGSVRTHKSPVGPVLYLEVLSTIIKGSECP